MRRIGFPVPKHYSMEIELYCNTCRKVVCHECGHEHKRTYWRFKSRKRK